MAVSHGGHDVTMRAAGTANGGAQFRFVTQDADGRAALSGTAAARIAGIQQNKPGAIDRGATVRIDGESKLYVAGTVNEDDPLEALDTGAGSVAGTANGTEYGAVALEAHSGTAETLIAVRVAPHSRNVTA